MAFTATQGTTDSSQKYIGNAKLVKSCKGERLILVGNNVMMVITRIPKITARSIVVQGIP